MSLSVCVASVPTLNAKRFVNLMPSALILMSKNVPGADHVFQPAPMNRFSNPKEKPFRTNVTCAADNPNA